jgi:2'-5' RNA ligase/GNAT superfamily N-acetyltransferase
VPELRFTAPAQGFEAELACFVGMDRLRLSVALLVDEPEATEIHGLRRALGGQLVGQAPPHVTLVPPVNVPYDEIDRALTIIRQAAASVAGPVSVTLGPIATFASNGVLYLPVENSTQTFGAGPVASGEASLGRVTRHGGSDALATIVELRDRVLRPPLWRHVSHEFVPHVTLRTNPDQTLVPAVLLALAGFQIQVMFRSLTLLQLGSDGVWSSLADCPLGKPLVRGRGTFVRELRLVAGAAPDVASLFGGTTVGPQVLEARDEGGLLIGALGFAVETVSDTNPESAVSRRLRGRVISLAVVGEERGFGLGGLLVQEVLRHLQAIGCDAVLATVDTSLFCQETREAVTALVQRFSRADQRDASPNHLKTKGTVWTILSNFT